MRLAVNASPEAIALRDEGRLPADLLKLALQSEWIEQAADGPVYVHFPFGISPGRVVNFDHEETDWSWVFRLMDETETDHLNLHIKIRESDYPGLTGVEGVLRDCVQCISRLAEHVPVSQVVVENVVARSDDPAPVKEAALGGFFTRLVAETGCGMLLDTAHLRITCLESGLEFRDEVLKFPLHSLREWHICGVGTRLGGDLLLDSMPMSEEDWQATAFVVAAIREGHAARPSIVALEYGGFGDKFSWRSDRQEILSECQAIRQMLSLV